MATAPRAILLVALMTAPAACEDVLVSAADGLRRALRAARPGARILIAPGDYRGYFTAGQLHGTAERPIEIAAADPARPPVFHGAGECLHLSRVSHAVLRDLVLIQARVNCLNVDAGAAPDGPSHHIVLDGLTVRDMTREGNHDGIKLLGVDDLLVRGCTVERWGSDGSAIDMVGCHRVVLVDCALRHAEGQGASGVQVKGGSSEVIVYRCRFGSAGQRAVNLGGNTGLPHFRPRDARAEARGIVVLGCRFVGSKAPLAFVGSEDCIASYNTIYRPTAWALRVLQETGGERFVPCRNGELRGNLVVWRWRELHATADIRGGAAPETFRFAGNWWYCEDRPSRSRPHLPTREEDGVVGRDPGLKVDGLAITVTAAPNHGAHAPGAARRFAELAPQLAPWAYKSLRELERPEARATGRAGRPGD